ncbi:MAG: 50S ribosomal protein L4 [Candidatus Diapherotrites archaeon]|nr:50S ribosomal protein L4 [Candidatus Diapherotrites archaeon]
MKNAENTIVYSLEGKPIREIEIPEVFKEEIDLGLIRRAVLAIESAKYQPKGVKRGAGRDSSAEYVGSREKPQVYRTINIGHARLPRTKNHRYLISGRVAKVPRAVGGPKAHPPKIEKKLKEEINKKEKKKALKSAIAATAKKDLVKERGHVFNEELKFPIVVENKIEELKKTKEVLSTLKSIGIAGDIERAKKRKTIRAGKGKRRGRRYKRAKSILFVVGNSKNLSKAARNLEGVDICEVKNINAKLLAPGTKPGRLVVWSEAAIEKLKKGI